MGILMGRELELFMSRFLKLFLLEISTPPPLCEGNASLYYALLIIWILSALPITAENKINLHGHNS